MAREKSIRILRVEKEIHRVVAFYLQNDFSEQLPAMISVTAVDVTSDLRKAAVYFRLIGTDAEVKTAEKVLAEHQKRIQKKVAGLRLKFCPVLEFRFGHAQVADDVDRLLAQLGRGKIDSGETGEDL